MKWQKHYKANIIQNKNTYLIPKKIFTYCNLAKSGIAIKREVLQSMDKFSTH